MYKACCEDRFINGQWQKGRRITSKLAVPVSLNDDTKRIFRAEPADTADQALLIDDFSASLVKLSNVHCACR